MTTPKLSLKLTVKEMIEALDIGRDRFADVMLKERESTLVTNVPVWFAHINGAGGEIAAARETGLKWGKTIGTFKECGDLEHDVEVRTRTRDWHDLPIREKDVKERCFILVTGIMPYYTVHGWIHGEDAMRDGWWKNPGKYGAAWFVPQHALAPLSELPSFLDLGV